MGNTLKVQQGDTLYRIAHSSEIATGVRQDDDGKIWAKVGGRRIGRRRSRP